MHCPLFKDFTRECIKEIRVYPKELTQEIFEFCSSDKHKGCPFYKMLVVKKDVCENVFNCSAFEKFQMGGFDEFARISNEYCTSKNHKNCARYKRKEEGGNVSPCLHPEDECIEDWKK